LLTAGNNNEIEKRLWDAADDLRANSGQKSYEYSLPVLGLIFLKHADYSFNKAAKEIESQCTGRRTEGKADYHVTIYSLPLGIAKHYYSVQRISSRYHTLLGFWKEI
jgi:type I restriction-modification system DNA methylase subunit